MDKKIFEIKVPNFIFPGFYNTPFDPSDVLTNDEGENYSGEEENYCDLVEDYQKEVVGRIINHYKKVIPKEFEILEYKLCSPPSYNYRNDEINLKISCSYEDILYYFINYEKEHLFDYVDFSSYNDDNYHEAMLETLLEFWPFIDDLYETTLHELFIYG